VERDRYQAWLWGELLLLGLLSASLVLFAANETLPTAYELPEVGLVVRTAILLAGTIVAVLAGVRFAVEGRRLDLLLACGFSVAAAGTFAFAIAPALDGDPVGSGETWADTAARLLAAALIAAAPFAAGRARFGTLALRLALTACALALVAVWVLSQVLASALPQLQPDGTVARPLLLSLALAFQSLLYLVALIGFGIRFRSASEELHRWLALGATFLLYGTLHEMFTPVGPSTEVSHADFFNVLGFGLLMIGVWRAIRAAEFGRAVAEERARVAREIHDGLAQYLFAISTQVSMLENGASLHGVIPKLKESAAAAQREARFAVLALSSASGGAPFDAALRRYVEFLTADGALDVELEIDSATHLGPDEQIEVFRIVQEGLANVRKHAGARRAEVRIGRRGGQRLVTIRDDGYGFEDQPPAAGQGLRNIGARAASIGGAFSIESQPGRGTALEIVLRT
jgi:signal transduction histidine kinase